MVFDPAGQRLACTKCEATAPLRSTPGLVVPLAYAALSDGVGAADEAESVRLDCPGCGATNDHPDNTWASSCRYCRLPFVGNPTSGRALLPGGVLPLAVSADDASAAIRAWLGSRWFAPRRLRAASAVGRISGLYSPIWAFDLQVTAKYEGRRGDDYQESETRTSTNPDGSTSTSTVTVTHTRWSSVNGIVEDRFRDVVTFAAHDALERHGRELAPWGVGDAVPYADDYLRGTETVAYTVNVVAGFEFAAHQTEDPITNLVREDIGGEHQDVRRIVPRYHHVMVRYLLLPAWLAVYSFGGKQYEVIVNGRTRQVAGTRPVSRVKVASLVVAIVAIIAVIVFLVSRHDPPPVTPTTTTRPTVVTTPAVPTSTTSTTVVITPTTTPVATPPTISVATP